MDEELLHTAGTKRFSVTGEGNVDKKLSRPLKIRKVDAFKSTTHFASLSDKEIQLG